MKKLILMCCILVGMTAVSRAQGGRNMGTPEERAKRNTDQLTSALKLTDDQKTKVYALVLKQGKTQDSLRTAANGDREAMREKFGPMMKQNSDELKALLTDDQKKAYDDYIAERRNRMRRGGGQGGQGGGMGGGNQAPAQ